MNLFKPEDFSLWDKSASEEAAEQANAKLEAVLADARAALEKIGSGE